MNNYLLFAFAVIGALIVVALWAAVAFYRRCNPPVPEKRDLMRGVIPRCEVVVQPRLRDGWQAVFPHAGEVFFPAASDAHPFYEIEIVGECRLRRSSKETERADALFKAPDGRFVHKHYELRLNNRALYNYEYKHKLQLRMIETDRETHRYRMLFEGERVALAFGSAVGAYVHPDLGYLRVRVTPLPADVLRLSEEEEREKQERGRIEARQEAVQSAERFARVVRTLSIRAVTYRNWSDPAFREKFARVHSDELIQTQAEIRKEATDFLLQNRLVEYLQRHNPAAVTTFLGRLETLQLAERVALDKLLAAAEASPPPTAPAALPEPDKPNKLRLSAGQLKLWQQQRDMGDKFALVKDVITREQQAKAWVLQEYPNLPEDEQIAMYQQILEHLYEDAHNGKVL
jgi:hypothetical protein